MNRIEELFAAAIELSPAERAIFLDQHCGGDPVLQARLEEMLRLHDEAGSFMEAPVAPATTCVAASQPLPEEKPGERIGRYKLLQRLGEGGCGVVYVAEQEEPVRRRAALKVIKLGMDTKEVIARFEAERQALALMDHPNIAKVLDAGATATGRPYFVMELVRGIPLTKYCDEHNANTSERLELFIQICHAVQHAHQKGIIHRDLKPSNILVTINDGVAVPKIIDFGIAKATQGRLTDKTIYTAFEQFIGTPAYMSPEQAVMTSLDIDTRSDIYSLGVLLYELLTGRTPFDTKALMEAGLDEIRRQIREVEPPKPSTRLSTMEGEALTATAHLRHTEAPKLISLVRGDLDWIVMRCLEKDRARRYETANGLAEDIRRHLANEPVLASPPSGAYRFRKLVRRHKFALAAAAAIAAALLLGALIATWQAVRATRAERRAEAARQAETKARQIAEQRRKEVDEINRLVLSESLSSAGWTSSLAGEGGLSDRNAIGPDTTLRQVLDNAAASVASSFGGNPLLAAAIRHTIGDSYRKLTMFKKAEQHLQAACETRKRLLGEEHPDTLASLRAIAAIRHEESRYDEAEAILKRVWAIQERVLGVDDTATLETLSELAQIRLERVSSRQAWTERAPIMAEAEALLREICAKARQRFGPDDPRTLRHLHKLFLGLTILVSRWQPTGKMAKAHEAEALGAELLATRRRVLGEAHPDSLETLFAYCWSLGSESIKKSAESQRLRVESLPLFERVLGPGHSNTAELVYSLAQSLQKYDCLAEASDYFKRAAASLPTIFGWDSWQVPRHLIPIGLTMIRNGQDEAVEAFARERLPEARRGRPDGPGVYALNLMLGAALLAQDRAAEAEPILRSCLEFAQRQNPKLRGPEGFLGAALLAQKKYAEAEPLLLAEFEYRHQVEAKGGATTVMAHPTAWEAHVRLIRLYGEWNRPDKVAEWQRQGAELNRPQTFRPSSILLPTQKSPLNLDFTTPRPATAPVDEPVAHWRQLQSRPSRYEVLIDHGQGMASPTLCLRSAEAAPDDFVRLWQKFSSENFCGRRIRFSVELKTEKAVEYATASLLLFRDDGATIAYSERHLLGTSDWSRHSIVFDVPPTVGVIDLALRLRGSGTAWMRNVTFEQVGPDIAANNTLQHIHATGARFEPKPIAESVLQTRAPRNLGFTVPEAKAGSPSVTTLLPASWSRAGTQPMSYTMGRDWTQAFRSPASAYVKSARPQIKGSGGMSQSFAAEDYRGRRVRLSAWIKTDTAEQGAWLWLSFHHQGGRQIVMDNMWDRRIKGTADWTRAAIVMDVPPDAAAIAMGFFLIQTGQMWVNDLQFEVVGPEVPVTKAFANPAAPTGK